MTSGTSLVTIRSACPTRHDDAEESVMAKCPKCSSRKGKRQCPALDADICSTCCGKHRLKDIDCPEDCVYLGREGYHRERRMEKSRSGGRQFLKLMNEAVSDERQWSFAFRLFVEVYAYNQRSVALTDGELLSVLQRLRGLLGKIYLPGPSPHPLTVRLEEQCSVDRDLSTGAGLSAENRVRVLKRLEGVIGSGPGDDTRRFSDVLHGFFGPLKLKDDLGYDPDGPTTDPESGVAGYQERSSGLIIPTTFS